MRNMMKWGMLAGTALAAGLLAACGEADSGAGSASGAAEQKCSQIAVGDILGGATGQVSWVKADAQAGLPAYCEVVAYVFPAEESSIGMVFRLPENWNGQLLGIGGGGWAGNVTLQAASEGLAAGYATAQTDGGHPGTDPWDNSWASNDEAVKDFAWRAIHLMTENGKKLVQAYYDREQDRAVFHGCSTGGRMALMEAQRFPEDYDAIISRAPVYTLQVQTTSVLRNNGFAAPGAAFSEGDLKLVEAAVLKQCDADDGLEDGLIGNPRGCGFEPATLQCTGEKADSCLAPAQVRALETIYAGQRASDGSWAQVPISKGNETGWSLFIGTGGPGQDVTNGGGMVTLVERLFGKGATVDYSKLSLDQVLEARSSDFAKTYEAGDPDLSAFFERGGKLLLWHGESDPGPGPVATIDYAEAVKAKNPEAAQQMRLFLSPGVGHCAGGPGADVIDYLGAMDAWASSGKAPETLIATKADKSITRKLCAWPKMARYSGEGDSNDPENWACVDRPAS